MGLLILIVGLVLLLGGHTLTTQRALRDRLVNGLGESVYKIIYSLVSIAGLALIAWGFSQYRQAGK